MHRRLVVAELAAACVSSVLAIITIAWPDWIERVSGVNPDHGNGLFEVLLTGLLIAAAIASSLAARAELRRGARAELGDAR